MRGRAGGFVRGFLRYLEETACPAAVLHGWGEGFEDHPGDVDLVVSSEQFVGVGRHVHGFAKRCGWRVCQVLRHESTAAFFVCSWSDDPRQVVALDICSDYRRNERVLIPCGELLSNREPLPWGGCRVSREMELRYRFTKAAVKSKSSDDLAVILDNYSESERKTLGCWLEKRWGLAMNGGASDAWSEMNRQLERRTVTERRSNRVTGFLRVLGRFLMPTGLVIAGMNSQQREEVMEVFGRLYFRRQHAPREFSPAMVKALVSSSLICCSHLGSVWKALLSSRLWMEAGPEEPEEMVMRIRDLLEKRCAEREGFESASP